MNFGAALATKMQATCDHPSMLSIRTHEIERHICEDCGHVSFEFSGLILTPVDRKRFARPVDQPVLAAT